MYHAECMKERYASVTPMLCLGNGYFMPTIHENRPYTYTYIHTLHVHTYITYIHYIHTYIRHAFTYVYIYMTHIHTYNYGQS